MCSASNARIPRHIRVRRLFPFVETCVLGLLRQAPTSVGELTEQLEKARLADGLIDVGLVYRCLLKAQKHGYVVRVGASCGEQRAGQRYRLTAAGRCYLVTSIAEIERAHDALHSITFD